MKLDSHNLAKVMRARVRYASGNLIVPKMAADSLVDQTSSFQNALSLKRELEEELPQLFDLKYTPKWNLYATEVSIQLNDLLTAS